MQKQKGTFFSIFFVYFLDYFGYAIVFGVFGPLILNPEYQMFSASTTLKTKTIFLGVLFAAFPFARFFGAPLLGDIADHLGRKKIFYLSISVGTIGYFLSGLAILVHSFYLLLFTRFLTGFFSGNQSICMASIADLSPDEKSRSKNYGIIATLGGLSWIISMVVGGTFSNINLQPNFNPAIPFWIATALSLFSLWGIFYFFSETHDGEKSFKFDLFKGFSHIMICFRMKGIRILYMFYLFLMMGWGINLLWLNPYTLSRFAISQTQLVILLSSTGIFWSFGSLIINKFLLVRFTSYEIARIGSCGLLGVFILCSFSQGFYSFVTFALLASVFGALAWTNALSTISLVVNEQIQGKIMGLSQSVGSISFLLAPLIAATCACIDIRLVYPVAAALIFLSLVILAFAKQTQKKPVYEEQS